MVQKNHSGRGTARSDVSARQRKAREVKCDAATATAVTAARRNRTAAGDRRGIRAKASAGAGGLCAPTVCQYASVIDDRSALQSDDSAARTIVATASRLARIERR